jgi:hypothetical protein
MSGETLTMETESIVAWTGDAVLDDARRLASTLDPYHAAIYQNMSPSRWLQVVDLGAELLVMDARYRLHHAPGRGRREHAAEIHAVLDAANVSNLVAAVALLLVLGRILDESRVRREDSSSSCRSPWT